MKMKNYALIYYSNGKVLKRKYDSATKAVYDNPNCLYAELFNERNIKISSFKNNF